MTGNARFGHNVINNAERRRRPGTVRTATQPPTHEIPKAAIVNSVSTANVPGALRAVRIPAGAALYLQASIILFFLAGSSAPTPLYAVYQAKWGFSPITTTVVFGVYALAVLASLLVVGRLSDHIGRRPVLLAAIAVQAATMLVFATAEGVPELMVARVIQGLSTGAAAGAVGAGMLDIDRAKGTIANAVAPLTGTADRRARVRARGAIPPGSDPPRVSRAVRDLSGAGRRRCADGRDVYADFRCRGVAAPALRAAAGRSPAHARRRAGVGSGVGARRSVRITRPGHRTTHHRLEFVRAGRARRCSRSPPAPWSRCSCCATPHRAA